MVTASKSVGNFTAGLYFGTSFLSTNGLLSPTGNDVMNDSMWIVWIVGIIFIGLIVIFIILGVLYLVLFCLLQIRFKIRASSIVKNEVRNEEENATREELIPPSRSALTDSRTDPTELVPHVEPQFDRQSGLSTRPLPNPGAVALGLDQMRSGEASPYEPMSGSNPLALNPCASSPETAGDAIELSALASDSEPSDHFTDAARSALLLPRAFDRGQTTQQPVAPLAASLHPALIPASVNVAPLAATATASDPTHLPNIDFVGAPGHDSSSATATVQPGADDTPLVSLPLKRFHFNLIALISLNVYFSLFSEPSACRAAC